MCYAQASDGRYTEQTIHGWRVSGVGEEKSMYNPAWWNFNSWCKNEYNLALKYAINTTYVFVWSH